MQSKIHRTINGCLIVLGLLPFLNACNSNNRDHTYENESIPYFVIKSEDFTVTGKGDNVNWEKAQSITLHKRKQFENIPLQTEIKMLYSNTGLYFLFYCQDNEITATINSDFQELWNEDVVEIFLQPDEKFPLYFEYELSPLNYELAIMVANTNNELLRWQPFYYETNRKTTHKTTIFEDRQMGGETKRNWIAEFFIPYTLLIPLNNIPPGRGDKWRANFYRLDYDQDESISWLWRLTKDNFHDYKNFGTIIFN